MSDRCHRRCRQQGDTSFVCPGRSSWGYFTLFCEIFKEHGLPQSIYTDCHSVFWTDREPALAEQLINKKPTTEVGRGLEQLGVPLVLAHSPQAKGRIEPLWNTFQDRLVSELRSDPGCATRQVFIRGTKDHGAVCAPSVYQGTRMVFVP